MPSESKGSKPRKQEEKIIALHNTDSDEDKDVKSPSSSPINSNHGYSPSKFKQGVDFVSVGTVQMSTQTLVVPQTHCHTQTLALAQPLGMAKETQTDVVLSGSNLDLTEKRMKEFHMKLVVDKEKARVERSTEQKLPQLRANKKGSNNDVIKGLDSAIKLATADHQRAKERDYSLNKDITSMISDKEYKTGYGNKKTGFKSTFHITDTDKDSSKAINIQNCKRSTKFNNFKLGSVGNGFTEDHPKHDNNMNDVLEKLKNIPDSAILEFIENVNASCLVNSYASKRESGSVRIKNTKVQAIKDQLHDKISKSLNMKIDNKKPRYNRDLEIYKHSKRDKNFHTPRFSSNTLQLFKTSKANSTKKYEWNESILTSRYNPDLYLKSNTDDEMVEHLINNKPLPTTSSAIITESFRMPHSKPRPGPLSSSSRNSQVSHLHLDQRLSHSKPHVPSSTHNSNQKSNIKHMIKAAKSRYDHF